MPISSRAAAIIAAVTLAVSSPAVAQTATSDEVVFANPDVAYSAGIGAMQAGVPDLAIPALEAAARGGLLAAKFQLAQVLSTGTGPHIDHRRAYRLFHDIAALYNDVDPWTRDYRVPIVERALYLAAVYERSGIKSSGMKPNPTRARLMFERGASFFSDPLAQFELAQMLLNGEGGERDVRGGLAWLTALSRDGYVEAQAYLGDLIWRGQVVKPDPTLALMLMTLAVDGAKGDQAVWLGEHHHKMFCSLAPAQREDARRRVIAWRERYLRRVPQGVNGSDDEALIGHFIRVCEDGTLVQTAPQETFAAAASAGGVTTGTNVPSSAQVPMMGLSRSLPTARAGTLESFPMPSFAPSGQ